MVQRRPEENLRVAARQRLRDPAQCLASALRHERTGEIGELHLAPLYMQLFNNNDFIFNCDYKFLDRYAEEENYFVESPKLLQGFKGIETNFIADVRQWFTRENVYALEEKGGFNKAAIVPMTRLACALGLPRP